MPEWIKEIIIAIGGGATVAVGLLAVFKSLFVKFVESTIDASFEKSTIKLTNKLERSTKAYEILLRKELDCYERMDPHIAALVPIVQDFEFWATSSDKSAEENFKDGLLEYIRITKDIKSTVLLYQPYIPNAIFDAVSSLLKVMQENVQYYYDSVKILHGEKDGKIDVAKLKEIRESIISAIIVMEIEIKTRLTELTNN